MLPRSQRLTAKNEVDRVFRRGAFVSGRLCGLKTLTNYQEDPRVAILVGTKIARKAVPRNRIRRRLREAIRLEFARVPKNCDLLVIARSPKLLDVDFPAIVAELGQLLKKIRLAKPLSPTPIRPQSVSEAVQ